MDDALKTRRSIKHLNIEAWLMVDWIACNATNLFKESWRQAEAWLMPLV